MAAPKEILEALHEAVGRELLERIRSGQATASEFGQAIKFLKDNGIEAIPTANNALGELEGALKDRLPFTEPDDIVYQ